uniref:EF-hand calcium binding domain 2 n=1 Tax=Eptatretus burgeri TaxID=7764 RepID=A0A8C4Q429_EPTBU
MAAGADETFTSDAQKFYEGELHKSITDAFNAFANEGKNTVDVRRIGPIIRSLGCFPTETELHSLLAEMEDEEPTGYIELETFLPVMTKMIKDGRYKPIPGDAILAAFQVLDQDDKGYLTPEELIHYMMQAGEPFTQAEMDEMISAAVDADRHIILYEDFVSKLVIEDRYL